MATIPPIELKAMYDGTELTAGTAKSELEIEGLADSVDTAATQMRASLSSIDDGVNTTLGTGGTFSQGVDATEAEGGRLKEVGTEVGAEFAANLQEGVASGDVKQTVIDTFSGLGAAAGATGQIGIAAAGVGLLLGTAIIKGMTANIEARRQAIIDSMNEIFSSLEITAKTTGQQIQKQILEGFDFTSVIEQLGGEQGFAGGMEKVNDIVKETGASFSVVIQALQGEVNPQTDALLETLIKAKDEGSLLSDGFYENRFLMNDTAKNADALLGAITTTRVKQQELTGFAKQARDHYAYMNGQAKGLADETGRAADNAGRLANNMAATATASDRVTFE